MAGGVDATSFVEARSMGGSSRGAGSLEVSRLWLAGNGRADGRFLDLLDGFRSWLGMVAGRAFPSGRSLAFGVSGPGFRSWFGMVAGSTFLTGRSLPPGGVSGPFERVGVGVLETLPPRSLSALEFSDSRPLEPPAGAGLS